MILSLARGIRAGRAFVEIGADDAGFQASLARMRARLLRFGQQIAAVGGAAVTGGAGLLGLFAPAIAEAGDFAEVLSKFDSVFGNQAESVREWAKEYGDAVGRSEKQLLQFLGNAQDTFVPLGFDPAEAEAFSKQLTTLAIDLASFNNQTDQEAFDRLLSSVVGNTENLRAFGVVAQDAQIKAEALAMGLNTRNLTAYEKAQVVMRLALRGTTAAQGDAIRTAGSYANQIKALQARFSDLLRVVGQPLTGPLAAVLSVLGGVVGRVTEFAAANQGLVSGVAIAGLALTGLGLALVGVGGTLALLSIAIGGITTAIGAVAGVIASPWVLGAAAVVGLGAAIAQLTGVLGGVRDWFAGFAPFVVQTWGTIQKALAAGNLEAAFNVTTAGLQVAWLEVMGSLKQAWDDFVNPFRDSWTDASTYVAKLGASVFHGLQVVWEQVATAMIGTIDYLVSSFQSMFAIFGDANEIMREYDQRAAARGAGQEQRIDAITNQAADYFNTLDDMAEQEKRARRQSQNTALEAARRRLEESRDELARISQEIEATAPRPPRENQLAQQAAEGGARARELIGQFNSTLAAQQLGLGGFNAAERSARAAERTAVAAEQLQAIDERTAKGVERLVAKADQGGGIVFT